MRTSFIIRGLFTGLLAFCLTLSFSTLQAQGDSCAAAVAVGAGTYVANGPSSGGGCQNCSGATNADWYSFIATADGTVDIYSCLGGQDTRVHVYSGDCGSLTQIASNDDACLMTPTGSAFASSVTFNVTCQDTYYIEWDDRWSTNGFTWNLEGPAAAAIFSTDLAATDILNLSPGCAFTAAEPGDVVISNFGQNTVTSYSVYRLINGTLDTITSSGGPIADCESDTIPTTFDLFGLSTANISIIVSAVGDGNTTNDTFDLSLSTQLNGVYTIGGTTPDYATIQAAADDLSNTGICGPVTMLIRAGTYNEQVDVGAIPGSSALNNVVFKKDPADTAMPVITNNSDYTWKFTGTSWVILDSLEFTMTGAANVIELAGFTDHLTIQNSKISGNLTTTSTSTLQALMYESTSSADYSHHLTVQNNEFIGGSYSAYIYGNFSNRDKNLTWNNNTMTEWWRYGLYCPYTDTASIQWNFMQQRDNGYGFTDGAVYAFSASQFNVNYNEVIMRPNGYSYGLYLSGVDGSATARSQVIGNSVTITNPGTNARALYMSGSDYYDVYFNSIRSNGSNTSTSYAAAYMTGTGMDVQNNIFANMNGGYGWYNSNFGTTHDNNVFYSTTGTATNMTLNTNEHIAFPEFTADTNLKPSTWMPGFDAGVSITGVTVDLDMVTRDTANPDIGAYEFDLPPNDAGISSLDNPTPPLSPGTDTIKVSVRNFGSATLTSATINWVFNGTAQTPVSWTGSLAPGEEDNDVVLGAVTIPAGFTSVLVYTTLPNGSVDGNNSNDTLAIDVCTPLAGTFTLGGATADFESFQEMTDAFSNCGVGGAVTVNVNIGTGPFNEQVIFTNFPGLSASNSITINGNGETVQHNAVSPDYRVIGFDGAKHITIDSLTVKTTATSGWAFHFKNASDSNTIQNCTMDMSSATFSTAGGIVASNSNTSTTFDGNNTNYSVFDNNTIIGSSSNGPGVGIYLNGQFTGSNCVGNKITNNTISDFYNYGIYLDECNGTEVIGNSITRPNRTISTSVYGLYMTGKTEATLVDQNYIGELREGSPTTTSTTYHVYTSFADADSTEENIFRNNIIGNTTSSGDQYGFYNSSSDRAWYHHNTVALFKGNSTSTFYETYGFYNTSTTNNLQVMNNIFYGNRSGSGENYCLYFASTGSSIMSDYNSLWVDTSNANNHVGYRSGNQHTLADWQLVNSSAYDQNSFDENPAFVNAPGGDFTPNQVAIDDEGTNLGVTEDYFGVARTSTPDIGAIEFSVVANDMTVIEIISPVDGSGCSMGSAETVTAVIKNLGASTTSTIPMGYMVNGGTAVTQTFTEALATNDTAHVTFTTTANLSGSFSNTVEVYTALVGDANSANDTLSGSASVNVQSIPYFEDFESLSNEDNGVLNNGWVGNQTFDPRWEAEDANGFNENSTGTGPFYDHTNFGTPGGIYMFMETSSGFTGQEAELVSPCVDLSGATHPFLSYWYFFHGAALATMYVDVSTDEGVTWTPVDSITGQQQASQTDPWLKRLVNLCDYEGQTVKIQFRGQRGSSFTSDYSIDDVMFYDQVPFYDAAVVNVDFDHEYQSIPLAQAVGNTYNYSATIANVGVDTTTNTVAVLDITGAAISGQVATIGDLAACNTDTTVSFGTAVSPTATGNYNMQVIVNVTENDTVTSNDTLSDVFQVSDTLYARDNGDFINGIGSNGAPLEIGQIFELNVADTITRISAQFDGNPGDSVRFKVYTVSGNLPDSLIFTSEQYILTGAVQWYHHDFCEETVVDAGSYFISAEQMTFGSNYGLGYTSGRYTDSTTYFGGGGAWTELGSVGFENALMLRAVFGTHKELELMGDTVLCSGDTTQLMINAFGNMLWSTGDTTATITVTSEATYGVTVSDNWRNCTYEDSLFLLVPAKPVLSIDATNNVDCFGDSTASILVSTSSGTSPFSYSWSDGSTNEDLTGAAIGTYSMTVSDNYGCSDDIGPITITEPTVLSLAIDSIKNVSCGGNDGAVQVAASGGTPSYSYLWSSGGTAALDTALFAGTYVVTVTDDNGCTDTISATITQPSSLVAAIDSTLDASCFGLSDGYTSVEASGGTTPYGYAWSSGSTTESASGLAAGTYNVSVTDSLGCIVVVSSTINEPDLLVVSSTTPTDATCFGYNDGSIASTVAGGTMPYNYAWSSGGTASTESSLVAGTYVLTVTDENGCSTTATETVGQPTLLLVAPDSTSNPTCFGETNGYAGIIAGGGTPGYSYLWSTSATTTSIGSLGAGTYTVTVTDAQGCFDDAVITLIEPANAQFVVIETDVDCNGNTTGAVDLSVFGGTPGYSYAWSNSATSQDLNAIGAGTYTVTVTDANGCTYDTMATVEEPTAISFAISSTTNVDCFGEATGAASTTTSGGTTPYAYSWSNSAVASSISSLVAGTYSVTLTDANGCSETASTTVTENSQLMGSAVVTDEGCDGSMDGEIAYTTTGGVSPYGYVWDDPSTSTTATITGLGPNTYNVTVTDDLGCTMTDMATVVTLYQLPVVMITGDDFICGDDTAMLDAGAGFTGYMWSNGDTTQVTMVNVTNSYSVVVTDSNGCMNMDSASVTVNPDIVVSLTGTNVTCEGGMDGAISSTVTGGSSPFTYLWNDPMAQTTSDATGLEAGNYMVVVTDAEGCTKEGDETIGFTFPSPVWGFASDSVDGPSPVSVAVDTTFNGYLWSTGDTTQSISVETTGSYSVEVFDANGCSTSDTIYVAVWPTGVGGDNIFSSIKLYPNPTRGMLTFELSGMLSNEMEMTIMSLQGTVVYSNVHSLTGGAVMDQIDLTGFAKGMYIVDVLVDGKHHTSRITLQ